MINIRKLREVLGTHIKLVDKAYYIDRPNKRISQRMTIKRKKKMILEKNSKGDIKVKRRNVIKIEIIE